jgi:hypothetical protein
LISHSYRPKNRRDVRQLDLEDGYLLFDKEKATVYTLNNSAALFWFYCDGNKTVKEIAWEVSLTTGIEEKKVLEDVVKTISFFQENGLLETNP